MNWYRHPFDSNYRFGPGSFPLGSFRPFLGDSILPIFVGPSDTSICRSLARSQGGSVLFFF